MRVLNIGGGHKSIPIPTIYNGWDHMMLDIDPKTNADIIMDARDLFESCTMNDFDAIYCSHNLEHYYRHDLQKVLAGFAKVIAADGFVHISVPNMQKLFEILVNGGHDIEDVIYQSPAGPVKALDMIYGMGSFVEKGNDFMSHKNGFTPKSLGNCLLSNGFPFVFVGQYGVELFAFAFKNKPSSEQMEALHLKNPPEATETSGAGDKADSRLLAAQPEPAAAGPTN